MAYPPSGASRFARRVTRVDTPIISTDQRKALLAILLATSERALEAFQAADNPVDGEFVADLERIIARTRREVEALAGAPPP